MKKRMLPPNGCDTDFDGMVRFVKSPAYAALAVSWMLAMLLGVLSSSGALLPVGGHSPWIAVAATAAVLLGMPVVPLLPVAVIVWADALLGLPRMLFWKLGIAPRCRKAARDPRAALKFIRRLRLRAAA